MLMTDIHQEASLKKERATTSDEQRERLLIAEQIERATSEAGPSGEGSSSPPVEEGLKRDDGADKVVLSFSAKPPTTAANLSSSSNGKLALKHPVNPRSANPFKRVNVLKTGPSASASVDADAEKRSSGLRKCGSNLRELRVVRLARLIPGRRSAIRNRVVC